MRKRTDTFNRPKTGYIYTLYKIGIKEIYIGSTFELTDRKYKHKCGCNNPNDTHYNLKVYQFIRENGGWDEWVFEVIEQYDCDNDEELRIREQYYLDINKEYLLNCYRSYLSEEERKEYYRQFHKEYYENNKEKTKEYYKEYYKINIEKIKEKQKEYREKNKELLKEKRKERYLLKKV